MPFTFSFEKEERLRKRQEFINLSSAGKKIHTQHFIILRSDPVKDHPRLGITVSRKVGNAVIRNRIKRLVREYFRHHKRLLEIADYNVIAKKGAEKLPFHDMCLELDMKMAQKISSTKC